MELTVLKSKYCKVPKDNFDSFLNYLQASLRRVQDLKNYIFENYPSLNEDSLEEFEYEFLRIPNLDVNDAEDLFLEVWTIFEKYRNIFERMEEQWQKDDISYYERLKYTVQDNKILLEHMSSWLEKTPQPIDVAPENIWTLNKSQAVVRDIIIIKTYIKSLKLIFDSLKKLTCVQFRGDDFTSSTSI
ncbi:uncharacterized protein LOC118185484 [Stegodyphus dumicola]|uniref:uncharacterized protein LOC118185484 n=1 Tax=Stegodyphus dumicola TaxID=202533 RepID=UPI0015AA5C33|nr:uncharacterized protein LOC118185484 [Stegodyphus dumicola]